ncbi:MAG: hypothetical protein ACTHOI_10820 [Sphingomicrobium sp.]
MSDSRAVGGLDRLPWLADEPASKAPRAIPQPRNWALWASAAVLLVAGGSFWLGTRTQPSEVPIGARGPAHTATVALPQPSARPHEVKIAPPAQLAATPQPELREARPPQVHIATPRPVRTVIIREVVKEVVAAPAPVAEKSAAQKSSARTVPHSAPLRAWPPRVVAGAYGRLVQIGAYGSRLQAKRGWVKMVHAYPAVAHLPAVVVETRNSRGRPFYRFQIGTTSQAHSEVLCQRMQGIQLSCAVVGLPWKAKVER